MESSARTASVSISVTKQHWIIASDHLSESEHSQEPKKLKKLGSRERNHRMAPYIQEPKDPKTDFYTLLKSQNHFTVAAKLKALA